MMKKSACVSLVMLCGSAFALSFTASEYVQDGLMAHYDAIENVAAGSAHSSSATTWNDLKGGTAWELDPAGSWSEKALVCDGTGRAATMASKIYGIVTAELAFNRTYKSADKSNAFLFSAGQTSDAHGVYFGWNSEKSNYLLFTHARGLTVNINDRTTIGVEYVLNNDGVAINTASARRKGIKEAIANGSYNFNVGGEMSLGAMPGGGTPFKGNIHAIRLYSRALTEAEAVLNSGLDRVRFDGESPATAFAASQGYSYSDDAFRLELNAYTAGGGKVAIKGGAAAATVTTNAPFKTDVAFVATPDAGYRFISWIGPGLTAEQRANAELTVNAAALATYEATFECTDGTPWWTAGTVEWTGNSYSPISWMGDVANWYQDSPTAHRFPAAGDTISFPNNATPYNVLIPEGSVMSYATVNQNGGSEDGFANTITLENGASVNISGMWTMAGTGASGRGIVRRLVVDGATLTTGSNIYINNQANCRSELVITNNARVSAPGFVVSGSTNGSYGGTGVVEVVDGELRLTKNSYTRFNLCMGAASDTDSWSKNSLALFSIGENGRVNIPFCDLRRNVNFVLDGGEFNISNCNTAASNPYFTMATTASGRLSVLIKDGVFRLPLKPTVNGHVGNERLSYIDFEGAGQMSFVQQGGIVTNCGIRFRQQTGAVPPRYEISGGEMYMISAIHNGDVAAGYGDGVAANGIAVAANAANGGTFSVKGGNAKVTVPRVNTVLSTGANDDKTTSKTYTPTDYRPHFETVITKTGTSAIELYKTTEVRGMHTVIPEGGMQIVTTNRFAVWRHAAGETLVPQTSETYFRAPNAALWDSGVFSDRTDEWGVTLKAAAKITPGETLATGVAAGWMDFTGAKAEGITRAHVMLKLEPQAPYTLDDIVDDLAAAGFEAQKLSGDYNITVDVLPVLGGRAKRHVIFDFNVVQDAVAVRDMVQTPKALVVRATADVKYVGTVIIVR